MEHLLTGLAARTGQGAFVADQSGRYHLRVDTHSLYLRRQGDDLVLSSPLNWQVQAQSPADREVLLNLLGKVTRWSRHHPQGLATDEQSNLVLEARLDLGTLELDDLEQALTAQVTLLETIKPDLLLAGLEPQWKQTLWRP
ncbi:YscB family type III secretion system chaperone [Pseudomonas sp. TH08]|uniref:YscB family type III secretion system chaperone n=1 Tax=unclassified Pseudomonas TaxID=196821 RepID=UPI00191296AA|nr:MULTISPECIES: YscB family type III secretion system chaperone [unclassified Pseudomonas]MBK5527070.1 YscB family type III secretion system chaperone [Pseudomonas sp. TH06]MBK5531672.1 YscB family type III secretion system chaperone [Pseudomonas sp. TH08]